jgi:hypothetical protein
MIGAGKPKANCIRPMTRVFRNTSQKLGVAKSSLKTVRPTHWLAMIPSRKR